MFTLRAGHWYGLEMWGDDVPSPPHASPVRILQVHPLKTGQGQLEIAFFHANYPSGVQEKTYRVRVLHRGQSALVVLRQEITADGNRILVFFPVNSGWLHTHWPDLFPHPSELNPEGLLERAFPSRT